ncbi:hypothetical protein [Stieleria varia]|uniref:Uncharacterized protein n=1 Tax=Stieleria varia TaxID=2528005 RepID=A0A5C6AU78_9BACT|nr:hypothetical protein [Stieleria varia]TWU02991.1 hypothetical protein Pla52n_40800 [Stieleria varia]
MGTNQHPRDHLESHDLQQRYDAFKAEGEVLAGGLLEIPRRVSILTHMYADSGRNHAFTQIAAHGALWGLAYFESGGTLGRLVAKRYFYNRREKAFRLGILREFSEAFRVVNRQVCIDSYANYYFTKHFGDSPDAETVVPAALLDALNRVHHASRNELQLTSEEKRDVFEQSFRNEQEVTVAPGVAAAIAAFDCPIMAWLCLHPIVRFSYFPALKWFYFRDFANTEERIERGLQAYALAQRSGWDRVFDSMRYYGQMPDAFFDEPHKHFAGLRSDAARAAKVAMSWGSESA